jgi:hypothetical protein
MKFSRRLTIETGVGFQYSRSYPNSILLQRHCYEDSSQSGHAQISGAAYYSQSRRAGEPTADMVGSVLLRQILRIKDWAAHYCQRRG